MAIESADFAESQTFIKVFTIGVGGTEEYVQNLSQINASLINSRIELTVVASGLDASVQLSQFHGNTETFADMGAIIDTQTGAAIVDTISNGSVPIISTTRFFFLGLELAKLTATTGTITVTGRL